VKIRKVALKRPGSYLPTYLHSWSIESEKVSRTAHEHRQTDNRREGQRGEGGGEVALTLPASALLLLLLLLLDPLLLLFVFHLPRLALPDVHAAVTAAAVAAAA
jgi:hypothetical protein